MCLHVGGEIKFNARRACYYFSAYWLKLVCVGGGGGAKYKGQPVIMDEFFEFHVAIYIILLCPHKPLAKKTLLKVTLEKL